MKHLLLTLFAAAAAFPAMAQYTIYPVPQKMTAGEGTASFSGNVCLVCDAGIDAATQARAKQVLEEHGLTASLTDGEQACTSVIYLKTDPSVAVAGKYDAHEISLEAQSNGMVSLTITGQHTDATFMGLASLEQMLDAFGTTGLPCVSIKDYADQQQRGLVEGYYGYPYSLSVKKDLMRFMMRMKMNTYLYGAKSDPYHSEYWAQAYPKSVTTQQEENGWLSQDMMREVCETSAATKVNFIWAIHPGNNFLGSSTVVKDIMGKFEKMHELGVRQFGVFVDDVSVPSSDSDLQLNASRLTELQKAIEAKWNTPDAAPADTVRPLHFVPQIYCRGFASSEDQYARFFRALSETPQNVVIYTTGWGVWSVPNNSDFAMPKGYLGRSVAWWWNYPCNDNADSQIFPMDMYQNFTDMPAIDGSSTLPSSLKDGLGIVANPMQQGEVAKIPLFSAADYAWNNAKFVNKTSWAAAFPFIFENGQARPNGDKTDLANALKAVAPFLTYNDPSGKFGTNVSTEKMLTNATTLLDNIALLKTMAESDVESERLLWRDLRPWVLKLENMLQAAQLLLQVKQNEYADADLRWADYLKAISLLEKLTNNEEYAVYALEGMGTGISTSRNIARLSEKFLVPYLQTLRSTAIGDAFPAAPTKATRVTNTEYYPSVTTSGNDVYLSLAAKTYEPGQYVGLSLPAPSRVTELLAADTLCQSFAVMASANGRDWTPIAATGSDTKLLEGFVKYLIVANAGDAPRSMKLTKNALRLTLPAKPELTAIKAPTESDYNSRDNISDNNLATLWSPMANQKTGDVIRLDYSAAAPVKRVRFAIHTTNGDYMKTGRIEVSANGTSWKRLSPVGKTATSFALKDMTPVDAYGNPMLKDDGTAADDCYIYQIYLDGKEQEAKYVRFYNQSATTDKWLRIAEFTTEFALETTACPESPALSDCLPDTSADIQEATYEFLNMQALQSVSIYSDGAHPEVSIMGSDMAADTADADKGWTLLGNLDAAVKTIDLAEHPYLRRLRLTTSSEKGVRIYEVVPTVTKEMPSLDVITSIRQVLTDDATLRPAADDACYDLGGRRTLPTEKGIYISGGKKILK